MNFSPSYSSVVKLAKSLIRCRPQSHAFLENMGSLRCAFYVSSNVQGATLLGRVPDGLPTSLGESVEPRKFEFH
jgi:hypothetical protein